MSQGQFLEETWLRLPKTAVNGAEYNSRERQPHPKCLTGTQVDLLDLIYGLLDDREKNRIIWLHGTAGVGTSTVAFNVTERMRACQNFPSIRKDVKRAIRDDPVLLDPDTPLCNQMEALFLQPLRKLEDRLAGCSPLSFVIDVLDECTSEPELVDLIHFLAQALRDPGLPLTHIFVTSRSESPICKAFTGEVIATAILLDGTNHSFGELASRHPDFPKPSEDQLGRLANRVGRRFIVASTTMKFIVDRGNDSRHKLQFMLDLSSELLPGKEVYKLYDGILSTYADPERAYLHLSVVAALADPLPILQISKLLDPDEGSDVETVLMQLRSVIDIPTHSNLPVKIHHSSIHDYVSDPSNCTLPQVRNIRPSHSLLAYSCFNLMIHDITESTVLLDALRIKEAGRGYAISRPPGLNTLIILHRRIAGATANSERQKRIPKKHGGNTQGFGGGIALCKKVIPLRPVGH
ncbi:hypothetical protein EDB19DRAFT_1827338 [Suillus lakei]|nr:hypothetical protein EDB19DRAFT_1827338 [Suillus lakei]